MAVLPITPQNTTNIRKTKEMARVRCTCGVLLSLPQGVSTARCPRCYATIVCPSNDGYYLPEANQYNNGYYHHQPLRPLPQLSPISVHGKKRAVLIGISYQGQPNRVKGSVNDVRFMTHFLVNWLGFPNESLLALTEEERNPYLVPTKQNIRMAFRWLMEGCQSGDSLVFFYSGLGSQVPDFDGDEADGFDESLCPVDYHTEGKILDDEINATIVRPLPYGAKLHAIIDTCRSGTFLDLPFMCMMNNRQGNYIWDDHRTSTAYKGTSGGTAICFSACDDNQTSLDTTAFASDVVTGALTYSFIEAVQNERGLTYGRLLHSLRTNIRETQKRLNGPNAPSTPQVPQLSSSEKFDIYSKPFTI
ncbi:hypothetical protein RHMOL_Rhmol11G0201300 [Rhododendron molle]|uniref:Uncharacterized protein n=1 Tax=Rhododendron molle TaxID=49168 RepID=A0ACC0LUE0_RHOML|nr:hypothetical protein RHMOL_Rhmol11G0201300 [Rhododendron molle]